MIVTESVPSFVSVAVCVVFCPGATGAKEMLEGLISTASCGVGVAFEEVANPAQPLSTAPPHAIAANSAATPKPLAVPAPNFRPLLVAAAFGFAMSAPPALVTRGDYGLDARRKYWFEVQLRDRRSPVLANILFYPYFFL